ncbi:MAG: SDR family oxidoreductase [Bacteroidetes bacterium]|nr:SDR family oxidoreductase [Bacteroidota bacterium]
MQKVLIVGASSGIGASLLDILREDTEIFSLSRNVPSLEFFSGKHFTHDIMSDEPLPVIEKLDALVYCPGSITLKPFHRFKMDDFRTDWELNFAGAVKVLQAYYPALKKSAAPSVLLFSTVAVAKGMPFHSSIAASKAAVEGLVKSLAAEWAPLIRVNAIAPSLTNTRLAEGLLNTEAKIQSSKERNPLKKIGEPRDIASMAAYLISNEAGWITGQTIHIDGGMSS